MEERDGDEIGVRESGGRQFRYCAPKNVIQEKSMVEAKAVEIRTKVAMAGLNFGGTRF